MKGFKSLDKTIWTKEMVHTFYDICIKVIDKRMRPNTHFDKVGWKFLLTILKELIGHTFTKAQLKNK